VKQVDRERIHAALLGDNAQNFPGICTELEELCAGDLRRIEPIIDEIVDRECDEAWKHAFRLAKPSAQKVTH